MQADATESEAVQVQVRLRALLSAALELSDAHDRDTVLQRIVNGAAVVAESQYAALGVYGGDGRLMTFVHHGVDAATIDAIGRYPDGHGLLGEVIIADRPVRVHDIDSDPRSEGFPEGHPLMRTFLGVPILRGGRRYGNLYVSEKLDGRTFDDTDEALLVALAAFAAGAIETTELLAAERQQAAVEEQARARRELLGHVIAAQEAERARVSRDLHDDVGQALTSVLLGLRLVEDALARPTIDADDARAHVADLRELVADALRRARDLAFDLRPTVLDDIGLGAALERLTSTIAARAALTIELAVTGLEANERLTPETETVLYRVVQEALTNVVRHAGATTASVTISATAKRVRALVEDDGVGFDPSAELDRPHLGVDGIHERAALAGGTVAITSAPGTGTAVMLEVPRG